MNKEIKEIIDRLSKEENYIQHSYCRLFNYEANSLLDFITNLLQEIERLNKDLETAINICNQRQKEIVRLSNVLNELEKELKEGKE